MAELSKQQGSGIVCPKCGGNTHVRRTRPKPDISVQERYRVCDDCGNKMLTEEVVVADGIGR